MASVFLIPTLGNSYQSFTNGGLINAAGFIDTFEAGTTTVTAAYTTSLGTVKHSTPIVLDSAGRIPAGGEMWSLAGVAMKFVIKDSVSSAIQTLDNIYGLNDPTSINNLGPSGATVSSALIMNAAAINEAQGSNIAIAATVNLTTATGNYLAFTGTGTVTSITLSQGVYREAVITNTCAFTNNTNILMLGATSITMAPNDVLGFRGEALNVVRNVMLQKASGRPILVAAGDFASQTSNFVLAGPTTGPVGTPTFRALVPADLPISSVTSALGADINMTSTSLLFDGPSVSTGGVGTWYVAGTVTLTDTAQGFMKTRLSDGTTAGIIASGDALVPSANNIITISLNGIITNPAGNLRISVTPQNTSAVMKFNVSGYSKDSSIVALRIA